MGRASECGSDGRRFETCQTPQDGRLSFALPSSRLGHTSTLDGSRCSVGSSNWLGLQIFILPTRVRTSYRLQYFASIAQWQCSSLVMSRSQVRILLEAPDGSLAQQDKSTTVRMSLSGVRVSHESLDYDFWIWCLMAACELWEFAE